MSGHIEQLDCCQYAGARVRCVFGCEIGVLKLDDHVEQLVSRVCLTVICHGFLQNRWISYRVC